MIQENPAEPQLTILLTLLKLLELNRHRLHRQAQRNDRNSNPKIQENQPQNHDSLLLTLLELLLCIYGTPQAQGTQAQMNDRNALSNATQLKSDS